MKWFMVNWKIPCLGMMFLTFGLLYQFYYIIIKINNQEKSYLISRSSGFMNYCTANQNAGPIKVKLGYFSIEQVEQKLMNYDIFAGSWKPSDCIAASNIAVIVPYRNRTRELGLLLLNLHPFLQRQNLAYTIFVVEQGPLHPFNKGATINAGYMEIISKQSYDCFIIHDVDCIPEDDRIYYNCKHSPIHLAAAIDRWNYTLIYSLLMGGAFAVRREQFEETNGFSNAYFGWGGEDDDFSFRIRKKYRVHRYPMEIARYKNIKHPAPEKNLNRHYYYYRWEQRYKNDGLNSLIYDVISIEKKILFTHIIVEFNRSKIMDYVNSLLTTTTTTTSSVKSKFTTSK